MNKDRVAIVFLIFTSGVGVYAGYALGAKDKRFTYDTMNFMLQSNRDLETVQNIKVLEGLQAKRIDEILKFTEVRVNGALKNDGIKESTIQRAKEYQRNFCKDECLGVSK
jgi:uncharacterized protein (DUF2384 family)